MLRLAHRVLSTRMNSLSRMCPPFLAELVQDGVKSAQLMVADNVAAYAEDEISKGETGKHLGKMCESMRCRPIFDAMVVEYTVPSQVHVVGEHDAATGGVSNFPPRILTPRELGRIQEGALLINSRAIEGRLVPSTAQWDIECKELSAIYHAFTFFSIPDGSAVVLPVLCHLAFDSDGTLAATHHSAEQPNLISTAAYVYERALLANAFAHCKNVAKVDITEDVGPTKKWCRRMRVPELKYHTLQIDPNLSAKPSRSAPTNVEDHSGKALHICRGHFRTYAKDGPGLFGTGRTGTFWVPQHSRGSEALGEIVKTYSVGTPTA